MSARAPLLRAAGALGALGVGAGAFGAHGLEDTVSPERLAVWATATRYLMWHVLALFALALSPVELERSNRIASCFIAGAAIFAGSLYLLVLLDQPKFGMITPIGGATLIFAWLQVFRAGLELPSGEAN
jgi:uncharacterized membrane protein YgdD (TMEM256/DUF423 family)